MKRKISTLIVLALAFMFHFKAEGQDINTFTTLQDGTQTQLLQIPSSHSFQVLGREGTTYNNSSSTFADKFDFTAYIPKSGSSKNGYLGINHENPTGSVSMMDIAFNSSSGFWEISNSDTVDFSKVEGTGFNCSGAVTAWGTLITCEEVVGLSNGSHGYKNTGFCVEIDPATKKVIDQPGGLVGGDKLWALGNFKHENVAIHPNGRTVYMGNDNGDKGYIFKFIATTANDLSAGTLYALKGNPDGITGNWVEVSNTTQSHQNTTETRAGAAGATHFGGGIEDLEIQPGTNKIYYAQKGGENKTPSYIGYFEDNSLLDISTSVTPTIYAGYNATYDLTVNSTAASRAWGQGADNLVFDSQGNLFAAMDDQINNNNVIWWIGKNHTPANPDIKLFAVVPIGAEPTGMTITPDDQYMFMSVMHPSASNSTTQTDATGTSYDFSKDAAIVISRSENLGATATPVTLLDFKVTPQKNGVNLNWVTLSEFKHASFKIERSKTQNNFILIGEVPSKGNSKSATNYAMIDDNPTHGFNYYRLVGIDTDGNKEHLATRVVYSDVDSEITLYPNPTTGSFMISGSSQIKTIRVFNELGKEINIELSDNRNQIRVQTTSLQKGIYLVEITTNNLTVKREKIIIQ